MDNIFFNAHHSPVGAYSTFALGFPGGKGGLGMEAGKPPNQNIYIGVESDTEKEYKAFPFYDVYDSYEAIPEISVKPFDSQGITRKYNIGTDTWKAENIVFTIYTPSYGVPDPETAADDELKKAIIPAVFAELTIDNTSSNKPRKAFFCYDMDSPSYGLRHFAGTTNHTLTGIANGRMTAIVTDNANAHSVIEYGLDCVLLEDYRRNSTFSMGFTGGLVMEVLANKKESFRFAICFFREGIVTSGIETKYYYTKFFKNLEDVAFYALTHFDTYVSDAMKRDSEIDNASLSQEQKFQICHAIKSYYGNTQLLECGGDFFWVVNEGEYRVMNTLDLAVDQIFYELRMNPWTVKNVLEMFVKHYSYFDQVGFEHDTKLYPGGRSFTHDMGIANTFSKPGYSAYEKSGIGGCFSYMTCEQLVNWILCATVYISYTNDFEFSENYTKILEECFESLKNRDNPEPSKRNGLMSLESSRTAGGEEITTYDALDSSIGQARNSAYLGVKIWAAYLALHQFFENKGLKDLSKEAHAQAKLCARTISGQLGAEGYIPGVLFENNNSKVIPIIEGLIFPYYSNNMEALKEDGEFGDLIKALKTHIKTVLVKGVCLFEDGGWKISSSSINSWLSKIYLCQFITRKILNIKLDEADTASDKAHVNWLLHPEWSSWCFCDQVFAGIIKDSKYYPRGVSNILWLDE